MCLQMNGAVSKVNNIFISHLTRAKRHRQQRQLSKLRMRYQQFTFHAYCGPRGQFTRWRLSRKRLSLCSVLRCPDL